MLVQLPFLDIGFSEQVKGDKREQDNVDSEAEIMADVSRGTGDGPTEQWYDQCRPASHPDQCRQGQQKGSQRNTGALLLPFHGITRVVLCFFHNAVLSIPILLTGRGDQPGGFVVRILSRRRRSLSFNTDFFLYCISGFGLERVISRLVSGGIVICLFSSILRRE